MNTDEPPPLRRRPAAPAKLDRLPPHDPPSEQAFLGCCLLDPQTCINEAVSRFGDVGKDLFYDLRNQAIFEALTTLTDKSIPIDVITLQKYLKDSNQLEQVGGISYIAGLPDVVASSANFSYYADFLCDKYQLRQLVRHSTEIITGVYEDERDVASLLDDAEAKILGIREKSVQLNDMSMKEAVRQSLDSLERYSQGTMLGIPTGFSDLDRKTSGLIPGDLILLAARPGLGKSSIAMNIADHLAVNEKLPVGVFSLEMRREALVTRMIASRARVNYRNGNFTQGDYSAMGVAAGALVKAPIHIDDTPGMTVMQMRAKARRMVQQHGIKLLIIDHLGFARAFINRRRVDNQQQEMSEVSSGVKAIARELEIPVLALCHINREMEKSNRAPRLSDLRQSGSLEQDGDLVLLMHRPKDDEETSKMDVIDVEVIIAKQRNGPVGTLHFSFFKTFTRFETAARVAPEDYPETNRKPQRKSWTQRMD